jgi:hypothetical protein
LHDKVDANSHGTIRSTFMYQQQQLNSDDTWSLCHLKYWRNSILYYLCAESTATRPITDTAQRRYNNNNNNNNNNNIMQ